MLPAMIFYGNCQAEFVCAIFRNDAVASSLFRYSYAPSFDHPDQQEPSPDDRDVATCSILCEQTDWKPFALRDRLPQQCRIVRFPPLDSLLLWPFNSPNPYNEPAPPDFPFGRFLCGDRVIIKEIERGKSADEILAFYLSGWSDYKVNMRRALDLERHRLEKRDSGCDVAAGDLVLGTFASERLFWNVGHPTKALMATLTDRIIAACAVIEPRFMGADARRTVREHPGIGSFLEDVSVPIHPAIVDELALTWVDPVRLHQQYGGIAYDYEQYFAEMIRCSIEVRERRAPQSAQTEADADPLPPMHGSARCTTSFGFFPDGFAGERLLCDVTADAPLSTLSVAGFCPEHHHRALTLTLRVCDVQTSIVAEPGTAFSLDLAVDVPAGATVRLELTSSGVINLAQRGEGPDERDLSVIVLSIAAA